MWNRDKLWKRNSFGDDDEIPMREKRQLRKCKWICIYDEIPRWKRDNYRNADGFAFMMKFQWETDQYSTTLNIQNPSVESRFWEEKNVDAKQLFMLARAKVCDVIIKQ